MSKLTVALMLGLGLSLPLGAMASPDDEVTIRVMQMNEKSADKVMRFIELPDAASEEAKEQAQNRERVRERIRENQHDPEDATQEQIMEQEREQEMTQDRERLMDHENIEDHLGDMPDDQGGQGSGNHGTM